MIKYGGQYLWSRERLHLEGDDLDNGTYHKRKKNWTRFSESAFDWLLSRHLQMAVSRHSGMARKLVSFQTFCQYARLSNDCACECGYNAHNPPPSLPFFINLGSFSLGHLSSQSANLERNIIVAGHRLLLAQWLAQRSQWGRLLLSISVCFNIRWSARVMPAEQLR